MALRKADKGMVDIGFAGYRKFRMTRCMAGPDTQRNTASTEPAAAAALTGPPAALAESAPDIAQHKAGAGRNAVAHKRAAHDAPQLPYDRTRGPRSAPPLHVSVPRNQTSALANAHFHSYDTSPFHY